MCMCGGEGWVAWKLGVAQWHVLGSIRIKWVGVGLIRAERTGGRDHGWWAEAAAAVLAVLMVAEACPLLTKLLHKRIPPHSLSLPLPITTPTHAITRLPYKCLHPSAPPPPFTPTPILLIAHALKTQRRRPPYPYPGLSGCWSVGLQTPVRVISLASWVSSHCVCVHPSWCFPKLKKI